ncbi:uncharacterized protein LOC124980877 isoform X5 [Sciurus carolinensis]|nr:uncharacterized protein LOC124980877 isoform X5 [Sciurus carolinensis]
MVTMVDLRTEDTGFYWCAIERTGIDYRFQVNVNVDPAPTTVSTTVPTTSTYAAPDPTENTDSLPTLTSYYSNSRHPFTELSTLLPLIFAVLLLLLMAASLLAWRIVKRQKKASGMGLLIPDCFTFQMRGCRQSRCCSPWRRTSAMPTCPCSSPDPPRAPPGKRPLPKPLPRLTRLKWNMSPWLPFQGRKFLMLLCLWTSRIRSQPTATPATFPAEIRRSPQNTAASGGLSLRWWPPPWALHEASGVLAHLLSAPAPRPGSTSG